MLTLRPYQIEGRDFLASRRFALLADEMRVGKTPQAILAAHKIGAQSLLVVCPAIAVPQWKVEIERWWPSGPLPRRMVWSYDRARMSWEGGLRGAVDVLIPDECHYAKNPEAARTAMVYGKDGFSRHAGAVWPLSGTPVTRHAGEFWPMLVAFGITRMTYEQFCRHFCEYDWTKTKIKGTKQSRIPELRALLAPIMLRRTRKQVAPEMPEISFEFLAVDPVSKADLNVPLSMRSDALLERYVGYGGDSLVDASRKEVAIAKALPLVEEIAGCLERADYKQTVVFAWHRDAIEAVKDGLRVRGISADPLMGGDSSSRRAWYQQEFKNGGTQVLVCQIIAAGTAIDLSAASHGYFLELSWLPADNVQAANRLVSMMKDEPVTFDICTAPGTIDDRVQRILLRRSQELRTML